MKTFVYNASKHCLRATLILVWACSAMAADRMYFSGFNGTNPSSSQREVLLVWGELEGSIPADISSFRIYRKVGSGDFDTQPLADIPNTLVSQAQMGAYFDEAGQETAKAEIIAMLDDMIQDTVVDASNYLPYLYNMVDEGHPDFSRFKRMLLIRYSKHIARACGRAFTDSTPGNQTNSYLITGVSAGVDSKPLGKTTVAPSPDTLLPAPENFRQVYVGGCSDINAFMDNENIHFNWDVTSSPQTMALRTMVYGYDIYRASADLGVLDLKTSIPNELVRINPVPIVVSGNTAPDGDDAFLATDSHRVDPGNILVGGDQYYYYLVARDLSGNYSATAGPLPAIVPDREDPVMPWNVHTQQEMDQSVAPAQPRLSLVWDQINLDNYTDYYRQDKVFCPTSPPGKACFSRPGGNCTGTDKQCTDISVDHYLVYRFPSFQAAHEWGTDSDGDLWPDEVEKGLSDPCDKASVPTGLTSPIIATLGYTDQVRSLPDSGKKIHYFRDTVPGADNTVFWYRISAVDPQGNQSALSPPVRGALWDRTQPLVDTVIQTTRCHYDTKHLSVEECFSSYSEAVHDASLNLIDESGNARNFQLYERCDNKIVTMRLLYSATIQDHAVIYQKYLGRYTCETSTCRGQRSYVVRFFGDNNRFLGESDPFESQDCLANPSGCILLYKQCDRIVITPDDPVISPVDPLDPLTVCANLSPGQCARVYRKVNGKMTPITSFCQDSGSCSDPIDLRGIVTDDVCLGVRVFSENGVGSGMTYFNCIPVLTATPPKAPLMEGVYIKGDEATPVFEVRWSSQSEGIAAFIVKRESESGIFYETLWDLNPDATTGQFSADIKIDPSTIEDDWCFEVRAMDTTLTMSPWSDTRCKIWGAPHDGESLGWPQVKTPVASGEIYVAVASGQTTPLLILSDDIRSRIDAFERDCPNSLQDKRCPVESDVIPTCGDGQTCLAPSLFCCDICGLIRSANKLGTFMVYRQEQDRDFVQISPLVEAVHCTYGAYDGNEHLSVSEVNDPLIHVLEFGTNAISSCSSSDAAVLADLNGSTRLAFGDWFPYKAGSKVRYKVLVFKDSSMEPEKTYTSGWLDLP